jgi:hypothetical protein
VVTSEGSFTADKSLFLKNGFTLINEEKPFSLLVKSLKEGVLPIFRDWKKQVETYKGLNIVYTDQCPWVARSIEN